MNKITVNNIDKDIDDYFKFINWKKGKNMMNILLKQKAEKVIKRDENYFTHLKHEGILSNRK